MKRFYLLFLMVLVASFMACTTDTSPRGENVGKASSAVVLSSSLSATQDPDRTPHFQPFNVTGVVTGSVPSPKPTGTCNVQDTTNPQSIKTLTQAGFPVDPTTGVCSGNVSLDPLAQAGVHQITMTYVSTNGFGNSISTFNHTLTNPTSIDLSLEGKPANDKAYVYGEFVTVHVQVIESFVASQASIESVQPSVQSGTALIYYSPDFGEDPSTDVLLNGDAPCNIINMVGSCPVTGIPVTDEASLKVVFTPDPATELDDASDGSPAFTVIPAETSTIITKSSPSPSALNAPITFTVQVNASSPSTLVPNGDVQLVFYGEDESQVPVCDSVDVSATGSASITCDFPELVSPIGDKLVYARFEPFGDPSNFEGSQSDDFTHTVGLDAISPSFTSNPASWTYGTPIQFTFSIPDTASGPATGAVTFQDGSDPTGTLGSGPVTLIADGAGKRSAKLTTQLSFGAHDITATYAGDGTHNNGSATLSQSVGKGSPSVSLAVSPQSSTFSRNVNLVAQVTGTGALPPGGSVQFYDGAGTSKPIGSAINLISGVATTSVSNLGVGPHTIYAQYSGDTRYQGSLQHQDMSVGPDPATVELSSTSNPASVTTSVTFTATVKKSANATVTPSGTITFTDGSMVLGSGPTDASGTVTYQTSSLAVGVHHITASFSGGSNWTAPTSPILDETISASAVTANLEASPNPAKYGTSVVFTASFGTPLAGPATGNVKLFDGTTLLATVPINQGNAVFTTTALTAGSHIINAQYAGDANHAAATASVSEQITPVDSIVALTTTAPDSADFGTNVPLSAAVTLPTGTATGVVTFKDGTTTLGTTALNASGVATFATTALPVGNHSLTATFSGDSTSAASTSPSLTHTVNKATPNVTLGSSGNPSPVAGNVTFTATVVATSSIGFTPAGSVTFKDGGNTIGSGVISDSGVATFSTSKLTAGAHSITATFAGDLHFNTAASATLTQTVSAKASTILLTSSPNPSTFGAAVTLNATLTGGGGVPTGGVTFRQGTTSLGTGTLDASGKASITTTTLPVGTLTLAVDYAGDATYDAGTSSIAHVVAQAATTTTLAASTSAAAVGTSLTFTATVSTASAASLTGDVEFFDASVSLGTVTLTGNSAAFSTAALPAGQNVITARYQGTDVFGASQSNSQIITLTVGVPDAGVDAGNPGSSSGDGNNNPDASSAAPPVSSAGTGTSGGLNIGSGGSGDNGDSCTMSPGAQGSLTIPTLIGLAVLGLRRRRRRAA